MKIIALEGLDKSGKHTQSNMLADALARKGLRVVQSEFHRYDTPTGKLIMDWLTKKWNVDQLTIELVMAADKQAQQEWFRQLEKDGVDVLILDRYTVSQWVYSQANGVNPKFAQVLQTYMRQPDHTILIDLPAETSMSRKGKHNNGANDRYESDREMLTRVRVGYINSLQKQDFIVDGEQSVQEIHDEIMGFVDGIFSKK